jgi:hypothetical protein
MNTKKIIKVLTLLSLQLLFCVSVSLADILQDLKLPAQMGMIKESYSANSGAGKTIIQIQDAHCNYEAQKKLASILEYLIKEQKIKLVMVEGGSGDVSLSFLRSYSDKKTREEVAEKYLKKGQISGEEYLDIVSDYDFQLYGVEDPDLYNSNLESFLSTDTARQQGLKDLARFGDIVNKLKAKIYGPALQEFDAKTAQFDAKTLTLAEYGAYLKDKAQACGLHSEAEHLSAFLDSIQMEKGLDFKQAEKERNDCIKQLGTMLDEQSVKEMITKTRAFTSGGEKPEEFYAYLKELASSRLNLAATYPNLSAYVDYLTKSKSVKAEELIREISVLEAKIKQGLCTTDDERSLADIDSRLALAVKFLKLELTPEEYNVFAPEKDKYMTMSWIPFLVEASLRYQLPETPKASDAMDSNFDRLESFYRLGMAREESFMKNMTEKMSLTGDSAAVLITGGFHTEGINRMLKDAGYSYAVVTPAITEKADPEIYFSVLRSERNMVSGDDSGLADNND